MNVNEENSYQYINGFKNRYVDNFLLFSILWHCKLFDKQNQLLLK